MNLQMHNLKIAILRNEEPESGNKWALACQKLNIDYEVIDITSNNWLTVIRNNQFNFFLLKPPGNFERTKKLYDERVYIISEVLNYQTFPSYKECYIYENKKLLTDFLNALRLPHPATTVFYNKSEAFNFLGQANYPIVAKTSIGGSGSGVQILKTPRQGKKYVSQAFSGKGIRRRSGPNRALSTPTGRIKKAIYSPHYFLKKIKKYYAIFKEKEKGYVIFQSYIPHEFEWRMVKIGPSFFGHRKVKHGEKASGSKEIDYTPPPEKLLDFTRNLCADLNFNFMAIDLFEDGKGNFLINELQTIFGHVQDYILEVNGQPGRFTYTDNRWNFEPGDFNSNESYDLRLKTAIDLYQKNK